jgi:hypothetical protein
MRNQLLYPIQFSQAVSVECRRYRRLPKDLLARLRQAIVEGDLEQITALLEQVHLQNEVLANALLSLANQYQFDQLLNFTSTYS